MIAYVFVITCETINIARDTNPLIAGRSCHSPARMILQAVTLTVGQEAVSIDRAQTPCTDGWFGPDCQYQCHCAGSAPCDKHDGSCSSGCHQDWFGPACQYARMSFTTSGGESWLTDNDDTTCNTGNTQSVTVTLDTPIPLTWVRVVVRDAGDLNQIQLSYQLSGSSTSVTCPDFRTAKVDNITLDIECFTQHNVSGLSISGSGVTELCSLYISGGRNVALKQTARQSSRYRPPDGAPSSYNASNAVDGVLPGDTRESARSTCSHTDANKQHPGSWNVTFSQAVDVTRFQIYNRVDCGRGCNDRLVGFTLTAQSDSSTATHYSYTDPGGPAQDNYTVVPSPRISFPVEKVKFVTGSSDKILTLCEVFIFGETNCPADKYGLRCERQCNCANNESCFVHSGRCPSGCATGFTGEDCSECQPGLYGDRCNQSCSATCGGDNSCDRNKGTCSQGCDPGYSGTTCETKCPTGKYGLNCSESCSPNCRGSDNACNHENGTCTNGCEDGYRGDRCDTECEAGKYGAGCGQNCSVHCAGSPVNCSHITGHCDGGCEPGYQLGKCDQECNPSTYGQSCSQNCSDICWNSCHPESGQCMECPVGFQGGKCNQKCNKTFYGEKCAKVCSTNCVDQQCDHVTGYCISCVEGRSGDLCVKSVGSEGGGGGDSIIPAVIGAVVAVVVITAIIVGFIIWRRRKNRPDEEQEAEEGVSRNGGARNLSYTGAALELDTNKTSSEHKQFVEKASQTPSGMFNNGESSLRIKNMLGVG
ncbi:hypothetical protein RRG08_064534 [Elysia crispata]|uniref:EGF-like domain-containing protein n=1 Tax=Elysia crispata TaxID=231223 RepID=A0AAE1CVP1_9GAST|nr:hypothetical protein RRG08_064534 [Elysia crispata]